MASSREGLERGLEAQGGDAPRETAELQIAQLTQLIEETESLTVGWQIDGTQRQTSFDVAVTALPGTKMAKQLAAARDVKTNYAGFLVPDAAIKANAASIMLPAQIEEAVVSVERLKQQTLKQIEGDENLDDATRTAARQLVETFFDIARNTVKTGQFDACASLVLKPKSMTLLSAGHVASGSEVEAAVKQLVAMSKTESDFSFANVKFNADQHAGVRFHTMELPIPGEEYIRKVFGETLQIAVGAADESAYLAMGNDGLSYLKQMIDASSKSAGQSVEPFALEIALSPILEFAKSVEPNPLVDGLSQMLARQAGKDHIRVRTSIDDNGAVYRFTLEEGVLRLIGQGAQMVGMQGGGGF